MRSSGAPLYYDIRFTKQIKKNNRKFGRFEGFERGRAVSGKGIHDGYCQERHIYLANCLNMLVLLFYERSRQGNQYVQDKKSELVNIYSEIGKQSETCERMLVANDQMGFRILIFNFIKLNREDTFDL